MRVETDIELGFKDVLIRPKRSTCTYVGASALRELTKRTTFVRVMEPENRTFE